MWPGQVTDSLKASASAGGTFTLHQSLMSALETHCATTPSMRKTGMIQDQKPAAV